jgi:hypothetical protein
MDAPRPVTWRVTCESCPWQVEGRLPDGRWFYLRYRFCSVQLGVGADPDAAVEETLQPGTRTEYHQNNAAGCPGNGYCSGVDGEEAAYIWQLAWRNREEM